MMESLAEKDESTIEAQYKAIRKEIYDKEIMSKLGKTEKTREDLAKLKENFEKDPKSIKNALEEAMENKKKIHSDSLDDEENINAINDTLESWGLSKMKSEQIKEFNGRNPMKFGKAAKNNKNWIGWLLELAFRPAPAKGKSKK